MNRKNSPLNAALAVELAKAGMTKRDLAAVLGEVDTTFSDWVRGAHPGPADLTDRIEAALKLEPGVLPRPVLTRKPRRRREAGGS